MTDSRIAAVRLAFGSTNPMPCLRGSPSREDDGIFYRPGINLEIVRFEEHLKKHVIQEFHFGALGARGELLYSAWDIQKERLNLGVHYGFAGIAADVRFPNRMSLRFNHEKSLQRGRLTLLNFKGNVEEFQAPQFLVKYEECEIQRGDLRDIWSPRVIGRRGQSGCAVPGSPLADLIETYKAGGFDVGLETTDLELMQKLSGSLPEGDLYMPVDMCDNVIPQVIHAHFPWDYSRWTVVSVESLRAAGLDRTLKEYDDAQILRAEARAARATRTARSSSVSAEVLLEDVPVEMVTQVPVVEEVAVEAGPEELTVEEKKRRGQAKLDAWAAEKNVIENSESPVTA